jgi:hypothetical protein
MLERISVQLKIVEDATDEEALELGETTAVGRLARQVRDLLGPEGG